MQEKKETYNFEATILPHLNAAFNFARWLTRNDEDAADIVQDACLRAFRFFKGYRGGDGRSWFLTIVRNIFYTNINRQKKLESLIYQSDDIPDIESYESSPEIIFLQNEDTLQVQNALQELPVEFREVIILRELEGFSYKEIADIIEVPLGTVMSRLSRGRKFLYMSLNNHYRNED